MELYEITYIIFRVSTGLYLNALKIKVKSYGDSFTKVIPLFLFVLIQTMIN